MMGNRLWVYGVSAAIAGLMGVAIATAPAESATPAAILLMKQSTVLQVGATGEEVSQIQAALLYYGYDTGAIDGVFDQDVEAAVAQFQQVNGLQLDRQGVVGAETQRVLLEPTIADLQKRLSILGYYAGAIDWAESADYLAARRAFVFANNLEDENPEVEQSNYVRVLFSTSAIGVASRPPLEPVIPPNAAPDESETAIEPLPESAPEPEPEPAAATDPYEAVTASFSDTPFQLSVQTAKQTLSNLGYYRGEINNQVDAGLVAALEAFQARNGLSVTGTADLETRAALLSGDPIPAAPF